jgi:hypothetical protein
VAALKRVKVKVGEKLTEANIDRVIKLLEQPKPITKKEACEVLNISYNPARLGTIIENHKAKIEINNKRRAANRGKPASPDEIKTVISEYLSGSTVTDIADDLYRSTTFVRNIIESVGVPQRGVGENYFNFSQLPEQCIAEDFEVGEIVWSARYQGPAIIDGPKGMSKDGESKLFAIWVIEKWEVPEKLFVPYTGMGGFSAVQPAYELGQLKHLEKHGVDLKRNFT